MVLLVVNTQKALVNEKIFSYQTFIQNIKKLIYEARKHDVEVIYVIHDDGEDSDLTKGQIGFEIFDEFKPLSDEKVFIKNFNSAFKNTGLLEYLNNKNEKDIIIVGLQTDKCINATVISGFEYGFHIFIPALSNSTVDNDYMSSKKTYEYYNHFMWKDRYAKCISIEETVKGIENKHF